MLQNIVGPIARSFPHFYCRQVFWLGFIACIRLPISRQWHCEYTLLLTAAGPSGIFTRFPIKCIQAAHLQYIYSVFHTGFITV